MDLDFYVPVEFGVALRTARFLRRFTLGQIAAATGIPTWRLSSFEKGIDAPSGKEFATVWTFLTGPAAPPDLEPRATRPRQEQRG